MPVACLFVRIFSASFRLSRGQPLTILRFLPVYDIGRDGKLRLEQPHGPMA